MPPLSLIILKYALMPSVYCTYLPPSGFVFDVMTATRISFLASSTPFSLLATNLLRSLALAVVTELLCACVVEVGSDCDFELPQAATTSPSRTPVARSWRERMLVPPDTMMGRSYDLLEFDRGC